ncbi:hypothetical protein ACN28I_16365 [Archangium gephyra]|uniref:hypothetical protein n=1 Tax=Archangium gephyra TaxID=48 RepID=UPI003B7AA4BC
MRAFFLLLTVWVGLPGLARAQAVTPYHPRIAGVPMSCMSSQGMPVAFVPNTSLADVGLWFSGWPGVPAHVEYNPGLLARLPPGVQLFWFGHACAHAVSGESAREESADCGAVQLLKREGRLSRAQVGEAPVLLPERAGGGAVGPSAGARPRAAAARLLRPRALTAFETQGLSPMSSGGCRGFPMGRACA